MFSTLAHPQCTVGYRFACSRILAARSCTLMCSKGWLSFHRDIVHFSLRTRQHIESPRVPSAVANSEAQIRKSDLLCAQRCGFKHNRLDTCRRPQLVQIVVERFSYLSTVLRVTACLLSCRRPLTFVKQQHCEICHRAQAPRYWCLDKQS